jgi:gluconolactonase
MSGLEARVFASDLGWTEGPVFCRGTEEVVVVSINRGHLYGATRTGSRLIAVCGGGPNGATEGADGSIYVAQDGGHGRSSTKTPGVSGGVQVVRPSGRLEALTTDPVSPNDLCIGPDGFLYVTDPTRRAAPGGGMFRNDGRLWRIDPISGDGEILASVHWYPNGIGFGRDPDVLYVADSGASRIVKFPLSESGLGSPEVAVQMDHGRPDGFCFDVEGNIVIAAVGADEHHHGDIQTWSSEGELLDCFVPGEHQKYTNVALNERSELVISDSQGGCILIVEGWPNPGLPLYPFR